MKHLFILLFLLLSFSGCKMADDIAAVKQTMGHVDSEVALVKLHLNTNVDAALKKVSQNVRASRDAITTHGVSGWTLFWAFVFYLIASKGTNLLHERWKRRNGRIKNGG